MKTTQEERDFIQKLIDDVTSSDEKPGEVSFVRLKTKRAQRLLDDADEGAKARKVCDTLVKCSSTKS